MNKILLASHGPLAKAIKDTAEFLMGENENVQYMCAYVDEESKDISQMIDRWEGERKREDTWIVVTDIFGGSVNNEFMTRAGKGQFYLLTGMNLPLLLSLWTEEEAVDEGKIESIIETSREAVLFCNPLLSLGKEAEDEEF